MRFCVTGDAVSCDAQKRSIGPFSHMHGNSKRATGPFSHMHGNIKRGCRKIIKADDGAMPSFVFLCSFLKHYSSSSTFLLVRSYFLNDTPAAFSIRLEASTA